MVSDSERHIRNMENLTKTHMFGLLIGFSEAESPRGGVVAIVLWCDPVTMGLIVVFGGTRRAVRGAAEPPRGQHAVIVCPPVITDYGVVMRGGGVFSGADKTNIRSLWLQAALRLLSLFTGFQLFPQHIYLLLNNQVKHSNFMALSGQNKSGSRQ